MFSRDIAHSRPTPRTLNDAFGPYARLQPLKARAKVPAWVWSMVYGVAVGVVLYVVVALRAGA